MVTGIRASKPCRLNKEYGLKFCLGYRVQPETPEEGWRTHWPKHCEYNNTDENSE